MLIDFYKKNGHTNARRNKDNIGFWVATQKTAYKRGSMSQERIKRLNDINFNWQDESDPWKDNFIKLKFFYEKNGHTNINQRDSSLGTWSNQQRVHYKKKKLSKEKIELLESINFVWDYLEKQWNDTFYLLEEFYKREGHARPSRKIYPSLESWCKNQRKAYRANKLSKDKYLLLQSINFQWDFNK